MKSIALMSRNDSRNIHLLDIHSLPSGMITSETTNDSSADCDYRYFKLNGCLKVNSRLKVKSKRKVSSITLSKVVPKFEENSLPLISIQRPMLSKAYSFLQSTFMSFEGGFVIKAEIPSLLKHYPLKWGISA